MKTGHKMSAEARANMSAARRRAWKDGAYKGRAKPGKGAGAKKAKAKPRSAKRAAPAPKPKAKSAKGRTMNFVAPNGTSIATASVAAMVAEYKNWFSPDDLPKAGVRLRNLVFMAGKGKQQKWKGWAFAGYESAAAKAAAPPEASPLPPPSPIPPEAAAPGEPVH